MHPLRKKRLSIVVFILIVSAGAITLLIRAFNENLSFFKPPFKIVAGEVTPGTRVKAGGCVIPGSVIKAADAATAELMVSFSITDGIATLPVKYNGLLPDLFAEREAAVIKGKLQEEGGSLYIRADEVLAKHDESYMPPEVSDAMQEAAESVAANADAAESMGDLSPEEAERKAMETVQHAANCKRLDYSRALSLSKASAASNND